MTSLDGSAKAEWAKNWRLVLAAAAGFSASGLHVYGLGPFVEPLQAEFGWSRAQTLSGTAIVSFCVAFAMVPVGMLIDRLGARLIGLIGILLIGAAIALLSTATGSTANWWLLWVIVALCAVPVQAPVWAAAVAFRFEASRGLALAVVLSGAGFGIFLLPILSAWLIELYGWRGAFAALGAIWSLVLFPILFFNFRFPDEAAARLARAKAASENALADGISFRQAMGDPIYLKLCAASGFFALSMLGAVVNFVPMLSSRGATPISAAAAASMIGIFSIIGRLGTGAILDRFSSRVVATVSFLLPIPACLLLLMPQTGLAGGYLAAVFMGLTLGAEFDVITYIASRRFGRRSFGAIQGGLISAIAVGSTLGPLTAAASYDRFGSYNWFLLGMMVLMLLSALLVGSIRPTSPHVRDKIPSAA